MNNKCAFIIIELLVALSIMIVLLYLTVSAFRFDEYAVQQEIGKLRYLILCMQHQARLENRERQITFYPHQAGYVTDDQRQYYCRKDVLFGYQQGVLGPPSRPTKALERAITFTDGIMQAHADGVLDAGAIYMTNKRKSVTYALTTAVGSESLCRIYRFKKGSWQLLP